MTIFIIVIFTIIFHYLGFLKDIENFFWGILAPASSYIYDISLTEGEEKITKPFRNLDDLKTSYVELYYEVEQVPVLEAKMQELKDQNEELRKQLKFQNENAYKYVNGTIIGKTTETVGNTVIIDIGSVHGVKEGNPVFVGEGVFIGKISRVENERSIVRLLNDSQSKVAATVQNGERSIGVVEGGYGISINMNLIPQNEKIAVGDVIITSGLEENIPRGLIIGMIESTEKEPYKPFQKAVLRSAVKLDNIHLISVITEI